MVTRIWQEWSPAEIRDRLDTERCGTAREIPPRLRTTNMQEHLNEEIHRRERVIRIFPKVASAHRLTGALLAEHHNSCAGRHDLDSDEFYEWREARHHAEPLDHGVSLSSESGSMPDRIDSRDWT